MVFLVAGTLVGLAARAFARGWSAASLRATLATLGVASVGALLGAMFASALPFDVDFLAVTEETVIGALAGAAGLLALLGSPEDSGARAAAVPVRGSSTVLE